MFTALKPPPARFHNRPAYDSECHATREMGIGELNNSYEDAELANVIVAADCNSYGSQTNCFLAHWLPNLQGQTVEKRKQRFPGEEVAPANAIFVDPPRTPAIAVAEQVAKDNVLHLDIEPDTDIALFNALLTYVVDQGWHDKEFIAAHTMGFDLALQANRTTLSADERPPGGLYPPALSG